MAKLILSAFMPCPEHLRERLNWISGFGLGLWSSKQQLLRRRMVGAVLGAAPQAGLRHVINLPPLIFLVQHVVHHLSLVATW